MDVQVHPLTKSSMNVSIAHLPVSMVKETKNSFFFKLIFLGVSYGCGVYFHTDASYSHNYAKLGVSNEFTMFLARVLVGKTTHGNSTMKTPPEGFDTTTDGQKIFVVYHDAGAYGEYLIRYK